jgi:RNA polymerase sigma factor (sigma-70 family)
VCPSTERGERSRATPAAEGARKRAAIETYSRHEAALRRTARRWSLCGDDAEDALQRGFEILLRKAPTDDSRELIRWTQTVVKHEAMAVRRERERILGTPPVPAEPTEGDWVELIPTEADGPPERAERREAVARSREALQALKPQELRTLSLLAEGYSYAEIGEITGYSRTKINRCLAEGRERFRSLVSRSEDGRRCAEMRPLISAFCDGEADRAETSALREHLRACPHCRATMRAYRAAPAAVAALAPALPGGRSFLSRIHDSLADLIGRFGAGTGESAASQVAVAGGSRGAGTVALAKAVALCLGTAGGAAACAATGVIPVPFALEREHPKAQLQRQAVPAVVPEASAEPAVGYEVEPEPAPPAVPHEGAGEAEPDPEPVPSAAPAASSGAVEYSPPPAPASPPPSSEESRGGGPAGEFGP